MAEAVDLSPAVGSLVGWTPIRLRWDGLRPLVDWCYTRGVAFDEPFFDQTIERCFRHPFRLLFRWETGMDEVGRFVADHPGLTPAAFIFHMSRCGSTLVSQMLASVPAHLVVSEAGVLDMVLRAPSEERETWLRWMLGALGQRRDDRQRRLFVKLDAWAIRELDVLRRAFPEVPWMFLYRDPVEVLVSQMRRRGAHVIPGALPPAVVGMSEGEAVRCSPVEYAARVLATLCRAALEAKDDPAGTFVDYGELPDIVVSGLAGPWGVPLDRLERERMLEAAGREAKNPILAFEDDRARKQAEASADVRAAADRWLRPLHAQLEQARLRQTARAG